MSKVYLKTSCMAAGKTALACICSYQYRQQGVNVLCIKPSQSTKMYGLFRSRINELKTQCINISSDMDLLWIKDSNCKVVIVDECQFLTSKQVDQIFELSLKYDIHFICYGLLTDFKTNMFEGTKRLIELGAKIEQIKHLDGNNERTIINARVDELGNVLVDGPIIDKRKEKYVAMSLREYWTKLGVI